MSRTRTLRIVFNPLPPTPEEAPITSFENLTLTGKPNNNGQLPTPPASPSTSKASAWRGPRQCTGLPAPPPSSTLKPAAPAPASADGKDGANGKGNVQVQRKTRAMELQSVPNGFGSRTAKGQLEVKNQNPASYGHKAKMTEKGYSLAVKDLALRTKNSQRTDGTGTEDDPEIIWLCSAPTRDPRRVEGILKICREACKLKSTNRTWVRAIDHNTARTLTWSRTCTRRGVGVHVQHGPCDPHITVYMGESDQYDYEGHLYVYYGTKGRVPSGLGRPGVSTEHPDWVDFVVDVLDRRDLRERALRMGWIK
ncbi:hypothetical protein BJY01DRAFT_247428 [Aspergillus pseudoustus]|uniref:Uncharacterized protein n=1 Tax=Aspergillus pseudoustus TaxID=1810923 RepID=A0ABR4K122_9EURO